MNILSFYLLIFAFLRALIFCFEIVRTQKLTFRTKALSTPHAVFSVLALFLRKFSSFGELCELI